MRAWIATFSVLFAVAGLALAGDDHVQQIEVGVDAPHFRLNDQHGKAVSLVEDAKGRWTVLAFYPKSDTPG